MPSRSRGPAAPLHHPYTLLRRGRVPAGSRGRQRQGRTAPRGPAGCRARQQPLVVLKARPVGKAPRRSPAPLPAHRNAKSTAHPRCPSPGPAPRGRAVPGDASVPTHNELTVHGQAELTNKQHWSGTGSPAHRLARGRPRSKRRRSAAKRCCGYIFQSSDVLRTSNQNSSCKKPNVIKKCIFF